MTHPSPLTIPPPNPATALPATVIFLHGFGDDADGWTGLVDQFHNASKLSHVKWILPNAPYSRDAMGGAWYGPRSFSWIPMPKHTGQALVDDDEEEDDEEGMMRSVEYVSRLIDQEHTGAGVPLERIVVGGLSQGCAVSLLAGLMGRYAGRLGGVVGLSGYLPLGKKIEKAVTERARSGQGTTRWFLAHGSRDMVVPRRMFTRYQEKLEVWQRDRVEARVYDGMGHSTAGAELRDPCAWLEKVLPEQTTTSEAP